MCKRGETSPESEAGCCTPPHIPFSSLWAPQRSAVCVNLSRAANGRPSKAEVCLERASLIDKGKHTCFSEGRLKTGFLILILKAGWCLTCLSVISGVCKVKYLLQLHILGVFQTSLCSRHEWFLNSQVLLRKDVLLFNLKHHFHLLDHKTERKTDISCIFTSYSPLVSSFLLGNCNKNVSLKRPATVSFPFE